MKRHGSSGDAPGRGPRTRSQAWKPLLGVVGLAAVAIVVMAPVRGTLAPPLPLEVVAVVASPLASALPASTPSATARPPAASVPDGPPEPVKFEDLSGFEYPLDTSGLQPATVAPDPVPAKVRALDGRVVTIDGFFMPLKMDGNRMAAFLLMNCMPSCCYGKPQRVNDWVLVLAKGDATFEIPNAANVKVKGRLNVKEMLGKHKQLAGLYRLECESITPNE